MLVKNRAHTKKKGNKMTKNIIIITIITITVEQTCQSGWSEGELAPSLLDNFLFKPSISVNSKKHKRGERES